MNAIRSTLERIRALLDMSLKVSDPRTEDWVIVSNVVDHAGRLHESAKDKIVIFLAGIQHETVISTHNRTASIGNDKFGVIAPPLYINLLVVFFANFYDKNYGEGLAMIARTIGFFQQTPYFTRENMPDLDPAINKLTLEMVNLDLTQTNYLMGLMGTKYLPSVAYRIRMIPFRSDAISGVVASVQGRGLNEEPLSASREADK